MTHGTRCTHSRREGGPRSLPPEDMEGRPYEAESPIYATSEEQNPENTKTGQIYQRTVLLLY